MTEFPLLESLRKRALEQGLEQGLRQSIQEALALRFDADAAKALSGRLAGIEAVEQLQALLRAAIQVSELAEFTRLLDEMTAE